MPNPQVTTENFFDGVGGGTGAPSAVLSGVNDGVIGTIVSQRVVDYIPFGKTDPEINNDGSTRQQLIVVLQTDERNWSRVAKVPLVEKDNPNLGFKAPEEDDGKRAIYLPQYSNIQAAVADAVRKTNQGQNAPLRDGARLGVKVIELKDTGKGNPLKIHAAIYEPPSASEGFFSGAPGAQESQVPTTAATNGPPAQTTPPQQQAPQQPVAPQQPQQPLTAPQGDPWAGASNQSAPAAGDPWASSAPAAPQQGQSDGPPF